MGATMKGDDMIDAILQAKNRLIEELYERLTEAEERYQEVAEALDLTRKELRERGQRGGEAGGAVGDNA
jgi:nitrate reductase assembly molybdenum cofactor insertion protein NarJ